MMRDMYSVCRNCKHSDVSSVRRVIQTGSVHLVQNGSNNIVCKNDHIKSMTISGDGFVCSEYEPSYGLGQTFSPD